MRVLSPQVFSHTTTYTSGQSEGPAKTEEMVLEEEEEEPAFCLPPPPPSNAALSFLSKTTCTTQPSPSFPSSFSAGSRSPWNFFATVRKCRGGGFLWKSPFIAAKVYSTFVGSTEIYFLFQSLLHMDVYILPTIFFIFPLKNLWLYNKVVFATYSMPKTSRIEDISPQLSRRLGGWWWLGVKGAFFGESSDHISRIPHPSLYCPERNAAFSKICGKKDQVCGRVREGRDFPFVLDNEGGSRTKKEERSRFLSPSPLAPPPPNQFIKNHPPGGAGR